MSFSSHQALVVGDLMKLSVSSIRKTIFTLMHSSLSLCFNQLSQLQFIISSS